MWAVAIRADHGGDTNRMVGTKRMRRRFHAVGLLLPMTGEAHLGLAGLYPHRIPGRMHAMATGASRIVAFVHATRPCETDITLVTVHADCILISN